MEKTYLDCLAVFGIGGAHPGGLLLTKKLLAEERFHENMVVLDAGCGTGQTAGYLATEFECQVLAVDYNPLMVEKATERLVKLQKDIRIEVQDIQKLPYEENSIDFVLSESVISFTTPTMSIAELTRVLKENGKLFAIEMVLEQPVSAEERKEIMEFYGMEQLWSVNEWMVAFLAAGLTIQSIDVPELETDNEDSETATDFSLSESIEEDFHNILSQHLIVTENYKKQLGVRIFKCIK
ncbi:class I SAM-dependent methyltransferase [Sporosarcina sp. BI001-red]|uniref:class I SAM-dependent methyltransferase n=1 Tax=Sporosarcina sp. BI001-red TaxID=2282866 RepID=UPI000E2352F7|nr:class I SAM-dependent methyltransferase [Sporosarcina sp. BI001-red]REB07429.1 class I SAM-dependent methyltransferase [Sporosarcina sp. BI001-red]